MTYQRFIPHDELYHYGVKGMKWGQRKTAQYHDAQAARHISAMKNSKTAIGRYYHNNRAMGHEWKSGVKRQAAKEHGLKKVGTLTFGAGNMANGLRAAGNYYDRAAQYKRTNYGKTKMQSKAFNARSYAKGYQGVHNSNSLSTRMLANNRLQYNTKLKTNVGRDTNSFNVALANAVPVGKMVGAIRDTNYYMRNRKR